MDQDRDGRRGPREWRLFGCRYHQSCPARALCESARRGGGDCFSSRWGAQRIHQRRQPARGRRLGRRRELGQLTPAYSRLGMWLQRTNVNERRAMLAAYAGYGLDGFDFMVYTIIIPTLLTLWGMSKAEAGYIASAPLITSAIGGW